MTEEKGVSTKFVIIVVVPIIIAITWYYLATYQATPNFEEIRNLTMNYIKEHYPEMSQSIGDIKWISSTQHSLPSGISYQYDSAKWTVSIGWTHGEPTVAIVASYNNVLTDNTVYWLDNTNGHYYRIVDTPLTFMWIGTMEGKTVTGEVNLILSGPENIRDLTMGFIANQYPDAAKYIDNDLPWVEEGKITYPGSTIRYRCSYYAQRFGGDNWHVTISYPHGEYEEPNRPWVMVSYIGENEIMAWTGRTMEYDSPGLGHYVDISILSYLPPENQA